MRKYKIGDKVRIRPDLKRDYYGGCLATSHMAKHAGKVVTVTEYGVSENLFRIKEKLFDCLSNWYWSEEMVEPVVEEKKMFTKNDLKNGDVIVRRNGHVEIVIVDLKVLITKDGWNALEVVNDDLTYGRKHTKESEWDIMKVYRPTTAWHCQFESSNHGELVYDRERDTKKPFYNGKVVCISQNGCNTSIYTVGKIYQFEDGVLTCDDGYKLTNFGDKPFASFDQFERYTSSKFIEIKE